MINIQNLNFNYSENKPIFQNFHWDIQKGESWSVLGPSGCGKSTLLYLLAGIQTPLSGEIKINGENLGGPRPKTGLVLQDYGLLPWEKVFQNVSLGLRIRKFYGPDGKHAPSDEEILEINSKTEKWVKRLGLEGIANQYPGQISGGQRQRTAIARTLATNPDILLLDEPFGSLDAPTRRHLQALVYKLHLEQKLTTIVVTHAIESAVFLGNRIMILGKIPQKKAEIIRNPGAGNIQFLLSQEYAELSRSLQEKLEASL